MGYKYQLAHRSEKGIQRGSFQDVFADFHKGERWLLISPHDDDIAVGFGMGLGIAVDEAVNVRVRIVTNGGMGYTSVVDEEHIQAVRRRETKKSFDYLGVRDFDWYGYPDGGLTPHLGRRSVKMPGPGAPHEVEGHTGLQNSIVAELRDFRPTRLFLLSAMDYHTDHKLVHQETLISLFHAYGDIWPRVGESIAGFFCNHIRNGGVLSVYDPARFSDYRRGCGFSA